MGLVFHWSQDYEKLWLSIHRGSFITYVLIFIRYLSNRVHKKYMLKIKIIFKHVFF